MKNAKMCQERILKQIAKMEKEEAEQEKLLEKERLEKAAAEAAEAKKAEEEKKRMEEEKKRKEEEEKESSAVAIMEKLFIGKGSASANKRLLIEYRGLTTSKDFKNFTVNFKENNVYIWRINFDILKFDLSKELRNDFETLSQNYGAVTILFFLYGEKRYENFPQKPELEFEVIFSQDFPFDPPFIRVVKPRFAFHTGHITVGGSICMEVLTRSGWTVAISLENLFVDILATICLGGGRIDMKNWGKDYTLEEAKDAFMRVARDHGWLKG